MKFDYGRKLKNIDNTMSLSRHSPFTETIVAGAIGVHQIISDIPQTRNVYAGRRH